MKLFKITILFFLCTALFSSCFKDEPEGIECDVLKAYLHVENPLDVFYNASDTLVSMLYEKDTVEFSVRKQADITALSPQFMITKGATIEPASGSVHDFTNPVTYTVTSEDGKYNRRYTVRFIPVLRTVSDTIYFDFEDYTLNKTGAYYEWTDKIGNGKRLWDTGNAGFNISMSSATPDMYPTVPYAEGYDGTALKLETKSTGMFGVMANKRLAAGNMFIGDFDVEQALGSSMLSTRFGREFDAKPIKIIGYYKYKAGKDFQNFNGVIEKNKKDFGTIYAVLYRNHDANGNPVVLYGDNALTSPQVVGLAKVDNLSDTEDWTKFELDFTYYEDIDPDLLENYGYNFTLVFSSSERGGYFEGAVGSTLIVDKVRVICSKILD